MAYVDTGSETADDTVVLRELKGSPLNTDEFDSSLEVIVDALNDLDTRITAAASSFELPETTETIASGILTLTESYSQNCVADTEGAAATDELTRISGLGAGNVILLQSTADARVITVEHGTYLRLTGGNDFVLNDSNDCIFFRCDSNGICTEITRSSNV